MEADIATGDPSPLRIGLPAQLAPLIGREHELTGIDALLVEDQVRLLTLVGPGGAGKTRLAVAVAHDAADAGAHVAFIDCAPLQDDGQILPTIARVFGLQENERTPTDLLAAAFAGEDLLIVLDNLEHIPRPEQPIAALLECCTSVTLLATSRRSVGLSGEQLWPVEPLPLPERNDPDAIAANPAVSLFLSAARRARPGFTMTPGNAATVAAIVRQLDGLPLAIELAAARLRTLSLDALLARLRQPLALLAGGARSLPARQRTIRETIAWSVDLLSPEEQALYADLGAFRGGFSLDAISAICNRGSDTSLAVLSALIDQSLVRAVELDDGEMRYSMLETIREEALERLEARGDAADVRARHASWFAQLAEELSPLLLGADQASAFDRLERELANLESALAWLLERGDGERALGITGAIWRFWYERGSPSEGRRWIERALASAPDAAPRFRARALNGLGALCLAQSDYQAARMSFQVAIAAWGASDEERWRCGSLNNLALLELRQGNPTAARAGFEQALACFRSVNEESGAAFALDNLGYANQELGAFGRAQELHQEALAIQEKLGNAQGIASALHNLGVTASALGDNAAAVRFHERQLLILRELGHRGSEALALNSLGYIASRSGDYAIATERYERALAIFRELGDEHGAALALHNLATDAIREHAVDRARPLLRESLTIRARLGAPGDLGRGLSAVAEVARTTGYPVEAVRLAGAASLLAGKPDDEPPDELSEIHTQLGDEAFASAWAIGISLSSDQAVGIALMVLTGAGKENADITESAPPVQLRPNSIPDDHGLTAREIEVLRLIAAGRSNAEIGEALFISPFTAKTHVSNLLGKLGVETRAAASTWAARQGIA